MIRAYIRGLQATFQSSKIWLWLYLLNLFVALLIAMPLHSLLENKLAYSLQADKLIAGFDYTVYQDFMNEYGEAVWAIWGQVPVFIILFMMLYIFLTGGILTMFKTLPETLDRTNFGKSCAHFFGRFIRLAIYFLIFQAGLAAIFVGLYFAIADKSSDKSIMDTIFTLVPIFGIFSSALMMVHDYAKIHVVHRDERWLFQPIKEAFQLTFKHFFKMLGLYWLNLLTFMLAFALYWLIKSNVPSETGIGILIVFVLGQIFLWARIGTKLLNLSSATVLYHELVELEGV